MLIWEWPKMHFRLLPSGGGGGCPSSASLLSLCCAVFLFLLRQFPQGFFFRFQSHLFEPLEQCFSVVLHPHTVLFEHF